MEIPKEDRIDFIRIKDFISLCILNWKWFVVSILLITSMGVVYVLRSPSVFSRYKFKVTCKANRFPRISNLLKI